MKHTNIANKFNMRHILFSFMGNETAPKADTGICPEVLTFSMPHSSLCCDQIDFIFFFTDDYDIAE